MNVVKFVRPVNRKCKERSSTSVAIDLAIGVAKRRSHGANADDVIDLLLVVIAMSEDRLAEYIKFHRARRKPTRINIKTGD